MKRLIITFLIISGVPGLIFVACCPEDNQYWQPKSVKKVETYNGSYLATEKDTIIDVQDLNFKIYFEAIFYTDNNIPEHLNFADLSNKLYATKKCESPGHKGLYYPIVELVLISDQPYLDYEAGERIEHLLIPQYILGQDNAFDKYLERLNQHPGNYNYFTIDFGLNENPDTLLFRTFTFHFSFSNGSSLVASTEGFWL